MRLGVRFSTRNPGLARRFAHAMELLAGILEVDWRDGGGCHCAIPVVDGDPGLFKPGEVARAQSPGTATFQGWIAFNPRASLSPAELFTTAVHEIGHVLGLVNNCNTASIMRFVATGVPIFLDASDLNTLTALRGAGESSSHTLAACCSGGQ